MITIRSMTFDRITQFHENRSMPLQRSARRLTVYHNIFTHARSAPCPDKRSEVVNRSLDSRNRVNHMVYIHQRPTMAQTFQSKTRSGLHRKYHESVSINSISYFTLTNWCDRMWSIDKWISPFFPPVYWMFGQLIPEYSLFMLDTEARIMKFYGLTNRITSLWT